MPPNGRFPASALGDIPGANAGLRRDAAAAFAAMARAAAANGVDLTITDGQVGRTYRSFDRQVLAKRLFGANAATPGYSNHGLALACDLMNTVQRAWIDAHGAAYGWAKAWSDAPWEWWHLKWREGVWRGQQPQTVVLQPGVRGVNVAKLQRLLRARGNKQVVVDGVYGPNTVKLVKALQRTHRLRPDGMVGPATWKVLTKR